MFKVIAEFVDGFETLNQIKPCISIFGSARTKPGTKYYELGVTVARRLVEEGTSSSQIFLINNFPLIVTGRAKFKGSKVFDV